MYVCLGSTPNVNACGEMVCEKQTTGSSSGGYGGLIAEKIHGFTEKLHSFGHHRSDSDTSTRARTGETLYI